MNLRAIGLTGAALTTALLLGACGDGDSKATATTTLVTAPQSERVDLGEPIFSDPTKITNPRFPISELTQVIQLGEEAGAALRFEITLLPDTKVIAWDGKQVETRVSQFVGYEDGRVKEVAVDFLAQADDGAVWYFGEDVTNYDDGVVANHDGTWLAGKDGPPGMIMPADPKAGDVYRPENIPGLVFEEVTVKAVAQTVDGPRAPVPGAILIQERLMDGTLEDKTFAPGYGEFKFEVPSEKELVDLALAVPTDAVAEPVPAELSTLSTGAAGIFRAAGSDQWDAATSTLKTLTDAGAAFATRTAPKLLDAQLSAAIDVLSSAVGDRDAAVTQQAAIDVAHASLDLQLQYQTAAEVDRARLDLWARQVILDRAGDSIGNVAGDVVILDTIWTRMGHTVDGAGQTAIKAHLDDLGAAVKSKDLDAAANAAAALQSTLALSSGA